MTPIGSIFIIHFITFYYFFKVFLLLSCKVFVCFICFVLFVASLLAAFRFVSFNFVSSSSSSSSSSLSFFFYCYYYYELYFILIIIFCIFFSVPGACAEGRFIISEGRRRCGVAIFHDALFHLLQVSNFNSISNWLLLLCHFSFHSEADFYDSFPDLKFGQIPT